MIQGRFLGPRRDDHDRARQQVDPHQQRQRQGQSAVRRVRPDDVGHIQTAELLCEVVQDAAGQCGDQRDLPRQDDPRQGRLQVEEQDGACPDAEHDAADGSESSRPDSSGRRSTASARTGPTRRRWKSRPIRPRPTRATKSQSFTCTKLPGWSSNSCIERIEARIESIQPSPVNSSVTAEISPMVPAWAISESMSIWLSMPGRFCVQSVLQRVDRFVAEQHTGDRRGQHDQREHRQEPEEGRCPGQPVAPAVAVPLPGPPHLGRAEPLPRRLDDPHTAPVPESAGPSLPAG